MGNICMPSRGVRIPTNQVRAYWAERRGLSNPAGRSVAEVLRGSGWIYSAGSTEGWTKEAWIAELRDFIRSQLGDVAFYSFDGGKNRRQRIDSLRQP